MIWETVAIYAISICLIVGAGFSLIGSIGLLKFNDAMTRLHAPTKVGTVGIGALLLAAIIHAQIFGDGALHVLLVMAFLFVTAPISANFMAKVNIHKDACPTPPPPPEDDTWSTLNVPEADRALESETKT
ncbi:monovalent cation/H(+) antiporter subunit G [Roseovarius sp. M141]|uniref:monovalent cation/H(+) antiporter subunit G n=1 Tax=Roseovarius sp. M141 TaxID=2583806 RepID=UPI0020CF64E7|nr:monovalent cation/H(+) antiporter subunit G [Roseovarius sp. M141]MCQ0094067.1 monovalent cation/H(+) antiporter subunit G [Roseovarius sp. M141]